MTPRAARLVAAAAVLSFAAAALAFLAPSLPEGLAAACAPGLVARELLAGLAVFALLLAPSFTADEEGRPREDHTGGWAALAGLPAVLALHLAGGGAAGEILPAVVLLSGCDLAGSSYLRLDPGGRHGTVFAAGAAGLLAGVPVVAWGFADLGGWEGAAAGFRLSPLLAIRDLGGGWEGMGPAILLLVAAAAVMRLGALRVRPAAAALVLMVALGGTGAAVALSPTPPGRGPVLLVGDAREGPVADLARALLGKGLRTSEQHDLLGPLPPEVVVVILGRAPRGEAEATAWREALRPFLRAGGGAAAPPGPAGDLLASVAEAGTLGLVLSIPDAGAVEAAADLLAAHRSLLPHPATGPEEGVAPALFRVPFPLPRSALPGRVLAYLAVLATGFVGIAVAARRRGLGQARAGAALAGLAVLGSALLLLPGLAVGETAEARLVLEERAGFGAATGRRLEVVRVERRAAGEGTATPVLAPGTRWTEVFLEAGAEPAFDDGGVVTLADAGRWTLLAGVSGVDTPPPAGPFLAVLRVREGRAWTVPGAVLDGQAPGEGPGADMESALAGWRRSEDPRVARAGWLLGACLRAGGESFTLAVPVAGVDGVVFRE